MAKELKHTWWMLCILLAQALWSTRYVVVTPGVGRDGVVAARVGRYDQPKWESWLQHALLASLAVRYSTNS